MTSEPVRPPRGRSLLYAALVTGAVTVLVAAASRLTALRDFNSWMYDFVVVTVGLEAPSRNVVLVDFDEETFARIRQFPIPRSLVAETIRRIGAASPRVVGVDLFFSEPRTPAEDLALQQALTASGNVIVASQLPAGVLPAVRPLPIFCRPENERAVSGFCQEGTPGALGYAFINLPFDSDGYLRESNLFAGTTPPAESFPLLLAEQYTGRPVEPLDAGHALFLGHRISYADPVRKTMRIGSWSREPARHFSAWQVLAGQIPASALAGKLVLVGQSNDAARDLHYTPLLRYADADGARLRLSGTQVHAAAIRTLLEGTAVRATPPAVLWTTVALLCCLAAYALLRTSLAAGLGTTAGLGVAVFLLALVLYARFRISLPFFPVQLALVLTAASTLGLQFVLERTVSREARAQRAQMMGLFSSYVDPDVAQTIWLRRDEVSLAGEERIATVMFTDIRSFTRLSAGQAPAEVLGWLNRYLAAMDQVIREHGGFLNKFIGDGLMIIFGLPLSEGTPAGDAARALRAARAMLGRVKELNQEELNRAGTAPQLRIGIGMHTGALVAGSIGSALRQEYSVIGDTVNLASRLESLNKQFGTEILFSQDTRDLLDDLAIVPLGEAAVAGLERPIAVFTCAAPLGER